MTKLTMTKIAVADLEGCAEFYRAVAGLEPVERIELPGLREWILRAPAGGPALVLIATGAAPIAGEATLVFETDDLAGMTDRVAAAGGTVTQPPRTIAALGLSYAMYTDPEGHIVEGLNRRG